LGSPPSNPPRAEIQDNDRRRSVSESPHPTRHASYSLATMAYNRPYNPDELPRFAEPEQKGGNKQSSSSSSYAPAPSTRYENKPPPPRPLEHRGSSDRYNNAPGPAGRLSPRAPPERYGMSPPPTATGGRPAQRHDLPPAKSGPPPSPGPRDGNSDPTLLPLFRAVDKDGIPLLPLTHQLASTLD
jgi:hypothetical protein